MRTACWVCSCSMAGAGRAIACRSSVEIRRRTCFAVSRFSFQISSGTAIMSAVWIRRTGRSPSFSIAWSCRLKRHSFSDQPPSFHPAEWTATTFPTASANVGMVRAHLTSPEGSS